MAETLQDLSSSKETDLNFHHVICPAQGVLNGTTSLQQNSQDYTSRNRKTVGENKKKLNRKTPHTVSLKLSAPFLSSGIWTATQIQLKIATHKGQNRTEKQKGQFEHREKTAGTQQHLKQPSPLTPHHKYVIKWLLFILRISTWR